MIRTSGSGRVEWKVEAIWSDDRSCDWLGLAKVGLASSVSIASEWLELLYRVSRVTSFETSAVGPSKVQVDPSLHLIVSSLLPICIQFVETNAHLTAHHLPIRPRTLL